MDANQNPIPLLQEYNSSELLDLLADGVYITDTDRRIVFWNKAAQKITGWSADEVVGRHCRDNVLVHVDKDGHLLCGNEHCPLHRSIVTGQPSLEPLLIFAQHRRRMRVPVEVTVAPIRSHTGEVIGGIEVFRDMKGVQDALQAKEIQQISVKSELPKDDRVGFEVAYVPREIVGGDFYRIEAINKDEYALFLADMRGHVIAAALYTICLRSLWNEYRAQLLRPSQFIGIVNERLHALVRNSEYFGTAVLAHYNAVNGEFTVTRAGHPAPLLFRANGAVEDIGSINPALGLMRNITYQEITRELVSGDAVSLYTDGATEVFDREDHELGKEGLIQLARAKSGGDSGVFDVDRIEERLLQFSADIHLPDDLTLIKLFRVR